MSCFSSCLLQAQHVGHIVDAFRLVNEPFRRNQCAPGEVLTRVSAMGDLESLSGACEEDRMLTHHIAPPQGKNSYLVALSFAHHALPAGYIDPGPLRGGILDDFPQS